MEIVSKEEARARGLNRYFTGEPCKNGHVSERITKSGSCVECRRIWKSSEEYKQSQRDYARKKREEDPEAHREYRRRYYAENADHERQKMRERYASDPQKYRDQSKVYNEKNREAILERRREWYKNNSDKAKEYSRRWKKANPEKVRQSIKRWRAENADRIKQTTEKWREENADKRRETFRRWAKENTDKRAATEAKRKAIKKQACPPWADLSEIEKFYTQARVLTETTGEEHHVDHIVPLQGRKVCGLHVETNLQVLTATENIRKGNRFKVG